MSTMTACSSSSNRDHLMRKSATLLYDNLDVDIKSTRREVALKIVADLVQLAFLRDAAFNTGILAANVLLPVLPVNRDDWVRSNVDVKTALPASIDREALHNFVLPTNAVVCAKNKSVNGAFVTKTTIMGLFQQFRTSDAVKRLFGGPRLLKHAYERFAGDFVGMTKCAFFTTSLMKHANDKALIQCNGNLKHCGGGKVGVLFGPRPAVAAFLTAYGVLRALALALVFIETDVYGTDEWSIVAIDAGVAVEADQNAAGDAVDAVGRDDIAEAFDALIRVEFPISCDTVRRDLLKYATSFNKQMCDLAKSVTMDGRWLKKDAEKVTVGA